jgi:hypothetical protein
VDLALVEVVPDAHKGEAPVADVAPALCARVDRATPGKLSDCVAVGYPQHAARQDAPFTTAELDGWIPTASGLVDTPKGRQPGYLVLKAEGSPPRELPTTQPELGVTPWAGMSGAAVFAAGRLVGVVAEHHLPEGDGSLTVVPIEWVDRVQDATDRAVMLQALGVASTGDLEVLRPGATARHRDAEPLEQARAVTAWIDLVPDEDRRASDPDKLHLVTARLNVRNSSKGVISRVAVNNMDIRDEYDDIIDTLGWTGLWLTHVPPGEVGSMETVIQYRGYQDQ